MRTELLLPIVSLALAAGAVQCAVQNEVAATWADDGDGHGLAVDVDGATRVAGARDALVAGAVYVTSAAPPPIGPTEDEVLTPDGGEPGHFGSAVALDGATWTKAATSNAANGVAGDAFGLSAAPADGTAVVGAPFHDHGRHADAGAAYLFAMPTSGWVNAEHDTQLVPTAPQPGARFGESVAVRGELAVVGAVRASAATASVAVDVGPATGPVSRHGELLIPAGPSRLLFESPDGSHAIDVPCQQSLVGLSLSTQGVRIDALDLVLGDPSS